MYDIIFAISFAVFLVSEGVFCENNRLGWFRLFSFIVLLPTLAIMTVVEFFFMGGDNILILIVAIGWLVAMIGFIINVIP